jgi:hypothetical protein
MAFASVEDIAARLGRVLTDLEKGAATFLLEGAQAIVEAAVERTEEQIDPLPPVLRFVTVEVVCRAMANPQGLASESETLGAYSHTERYSGEGVSDILLTKLEELMVRRAVHGTLSATAQTGSVVSDTYALYRMAPSLVNGQWIWDGVGS